MANQNRLTVLLGAEAMMEVTPLSCKTLTEKVINQQQREAINDKYGSTPVSRIIYERLREYYSDGFSHEMTHTIAVMTNQSEAFRLGFNYRDYIMWIDIR